MALHGVDVASYQGPPGTWGRPAGDIAWAAVKFTELSPGQDENTAYRNPEAAADWQFLRQHGKGRVAYLFGHPGTDPALTVKVFADAVRAAGLTDEDMTGVDIEVTDGLPPAQVAAWLRTVLQGLFHELGREPLCYTFLDFAAEGNCDGCGTFPLWISDPSSPAGRPRVPRPWKLWTLHQYDTSAPIDRDVAAYPTLRAMRAALGKPGAVHVHAPRKTVRKVTGPVRKVIRTEPVVSAKSAAAALQAAVALLAVHLGWHLSATNLHWIIVALPAAATIFSALRTDKPGVVLPMGAVSTVISAAGAFGIHGVTPAELATILPFITASLGLGIRGAVSPKPTATAAVAAT